MIPVFLAPSVWVACGVSFLSGWLAITDTKTHLLLICKSYACVAVSFTCVFTNRSHALRHTPDHTKKENNMYTFSFGCCARFPFTPAVVVVIP
jgi:NADH:ubiquinone oxidoreductase subunit E